MKRLSTTMILISTQIKNVITEQRPIDKVIAPTKTRELKTLFELRRKSKQTLKTKKEEKNKYIPLHYIHCTLHKK